MNDVTNSSRDRHWIIPVGTHVVTRVEIKGPAGTPLRRRGVVGVVVRAPTDPAHPYRVRFPDGLEAALRREELAIRSHLVRDDFERASSRVMAGVELYDYVVYRCVVGSRAYGLEETGSDVDRRGIYLPPADLLWSLYGVPEQLEDPTAQACYWEVQKFLLLALKANPNVLECLYTPVVELAKPLAQELLAMRSIFLSKLIYQTYNGYVLSQFKKLDADLRNKGTIKWKHAMHLIRLLLSGVEALRHGEIQVRVEEHRERLLAIRRGEVPWGEVNAWRLRLHREFDAAFERTRLPERPDYQRANAFLVKARRSML